MLKVSLAAFVAAVVVVPAAFGQSKSFPVISGELGIEVEDDWAYKSDDRANQHNDLYATIEPSATVQFTKEFSVFAHAVLEPVRDAEKFDNRVFEDHGVYVEDLYVNYDTGTWAIRGGKLNVGFGVAWDRTPGVYGTDFAEAGYETSERIGIIGSYAVDAGNNGAHRISAGTFFFDTSILSESALRGRGDTHKADGGVSNTESFESYVVALDGEKIAALGGLGYHVA
jgi:hypothetical protein